MAKRLFKSSAINFTAQSAAAALTSSTYMALKGGNASQTIDVLEVMISGKATASAVAAFELHRSSTLATTPTAIAAPHADGAMHPATAALATTPVPFVAAATGPLASNTVTDAQLNLALNAFGGIVRWNAAPTQQWTIVGNTAPAGESVLFNSLHGGGSTALADAHILYEPY